MTIVLQQMAVRCEAVLAGHHARAHEQIQMSVTVEITGRHHRSILKEIGERVAYASKVSRAIVQIQSVARLIGRSRKFVAAADHVQVGMPVSVGIEKQRVHVLRNAVCGKIRIDAPSHAAVLLLQHDPPWLPLRAADEQVVQAITIHITNGKGRPFGRQHVRHQRFTIEVVERIFLVYVGKRQLGRHIGKNRFRRRCAERGIRRFTIPPAR